MASYMELRNLYSDDVLKNRIDVACIVAAETIRNESDQTGNHANRLVWARRAFTNTNSIRDAMLKALLAANKDADVAAIQAVLDPALQTLVDDAVNIFADGS